MLSQSGSSMFVLPLTVLGALWLFRTDRHAAAGSVVASAAAGALTGAALQHLIYRARPAEGRERKSTSSFPSTHTLTSTAAYGALAAALADSDAPAERAAAALLACTIPFVAASRVLLGMHWLSDVVASAAMGGVIAGGAAATARRARQAAGVWNQQSSSGS